MAHLIDKDALVAEIERRIKVCQDYVRCNLTENTRIGNHAQQLELNEILDFLDTLEVKEVDLKKEYEEFVVDYPILGNFITNDTMGMELAKHFFELGLKAQKGE